MAAGDNSTAAGARTSESFGLLKTIVFYAVIVAINLLLAEAFLRIADFRELRVFPESARLPVDYDAELGWYPVPGKLTPGGQPINSIGLRDIELQDADKPTIVFVGDSFVYGLGVNGDQRFTDLLRRELPAWRVVNVGVPGYGTDQEYLMLKRLWAKLKPRVVVLIVCVENDHDDNSRNARNGRTFKPYLVRDGGTWQFHGLPTPHGPHWYYDNNAFAEHVALARLGVYLYLLIRHPSFVVPDPTDPLVAMMRDWVTANGAKFLVGLQKPDPELEPFLAAQKIPAVRFDGAPVIPTDTHWNQEGHAMVAQRLKEFLSAQGALEVAAAARP